MKQLIEFPQQFLAIYVHINWRAFELLWLFLKDLTILNFKFS